MLNVVVLNGGRGAATLIPALLDRQGLHVTSVVNAYDDGKSTGEIRHFFGMLGPSDIRKVQELMLPQDDPNHISNVKLFSYRYPVPCDRLSIIEDMNCFANSKSDSLAGIHIDSVPILGNLRLFIRKFLDVLCLIEKVKNTHMSFADCSLMNCIYAGAFLVFRRDLEAATKAIDRLFRLRGVVLPTSNDNLRMVALRENGIMLYKESEIVELRSNIRIERIYLLDHLLEPGQFELLSLDDKRSYLEQHHCSSSVSPGVDRAIRQADIIIYAAGTQHSSLYPTYLASGLASAIADNQSAQKVFIINIGADYETPSYKASDYILGAFRYLTLSGSRNYLPLELFSEILVNKLRLKTDESYIEFDAEGFPDWDIPITVGDYEAAEHPGKHDGNILVETILAGHKYRCQLPVVKHPND